VGSIRSAVLVKRGRIEGHIRPTGGRFAEAGLLPRPLTRFVAPLFGVHCVDTTDRVFALTYDDGPHPVHTPRILDELREHNAHATFFVLLEPARRHPDIVRRIVAEGHEVALHGVTHRSLLSIPARRAVDEIVAAREELERLAGAPVQLFRPPYGHHTPRQARLLRRHGLELVIWSGDGLDWIDDAVDRVAERAWASVFPGGILLLHDDRADPETLKEGESLPRFDKAALTSMILEAATAAGFRGTTVGALLRDHAWVVSGSREKMFTA